MESSVIPSPEEEGGIQVASASGEAAVITALGGLSIRDDPKSSDDPTTDTILHVGAPPSSGGKMYLSSLVPHAVPTRDGAPASPGGTGRRASWNDTGKKRASIGLTLGHLPGVAMPPGVTPSGGSN